MLSLTDRKLYSSARQEVQPGITPRSLTVRHHRTKGEASLGKSRIHIEQRRGKGAKSMARGDIIDIYINWGRSSLKIITNEIRLT